MDRVYEVEFLMGKHEEADIFRDLRRKLFLGIDDNWEDLENKKTALGIWKICKFKKIRQLLLLERKKHVSRNESYI